MNEIELMRSMEKELKGSFDRVLQGNSVIETYEKSNLEDIVPRVSA